MAKRKNYSIREDLAISLGSFSLELENEIGLSIPRQLILDTLVELMVTCPTTKNKVFKTIKNGQR